MCSFHLPWIPEFSYIENKIKKPFEVDKAMKFIQQKIDEGDIYNSNESLFWTILHLYQMNKLELISNRKVIKKYFNDLKNVNGGFKASIKVDDPDIWSTFYAISIIKILEFDELIEEKDVEFILNSQGLATGSDGGFIHCRSGYCFVDCEGKTSSKSTFFAISALFLLNKLDRIDKFKLLNHLRKNTNDDLDSIFQIIGLIMIGEIEEININKKISSFRIFKSGFKIKQGYPSVEYIYWVTTCLVLLNKIDSINLGDLINFLKAMQQDDGGFTNHYAGISSKGPTIVSTSMSLIMIFSIWKEIINLIENDIIRSARDSLDIYLEIISKKYGVPTKLVKRVGIWLISNKWIEGKIQNKSDLFQKYFNYQNIIPQTIITKLMEIIKSKYHVGKIDLIEFSKQFSFSHSLERVKLVINDMIINNFLIGTIKSVSNLKSVRKKYIFDDFEILEDYIHITNPVLYREILSEKARMSEAIRKHSIILSKSLEFIAINSQEALTLIEQEKIFEAKEKVNELSESIGIRIRKFDVILNTIRYDHQFINSPSIIEKLKENWKSDFLIIKDTLEQQKNELVEKIKNKEKFIAERTKKGIELSVVEKLQEHLEEIDKKMQFQINLTDHKASRKLSKSISEFLQKSDSEIKAKISDIEPKIEFERYKKSIELLQKSWDIKKKKSENYLILYQKAIANRGEIKKYIKNKINTFQQLFDEKSIQIINLINENKLQESATLLDESIKTLSNFIQLENEAFSQLINSVEQKIKIFSNYSSDLKLNWTEGIKDENIRWQEVASELKHKIYSNMEVQQKEELFQKLDDIVGDLEWLMDNIRLTTEALIKAKSFDDAENKNKDMQIELNNKLKKYDIEFKEYIKQSISRFPQISEIEKELYQNWEVEKKKIATLLKDIKVDLGKNIDTSGSAAKKAQLHEIIKIGSSEIERNINEIETNYREILKFKKNINEFEENFNLDISLLKDSLKKLDQEIMDFVKSESKTYDNFKTFVSKEFENWKFSKLSIEEILETLEKKIRENFFIKKVIYYVNAFKGKKIDLRSLSEMMKIKVKPLKLKLIDLISNSRLLGELDSITNTLSLADTQVIDPFPIQRKTTKEKMEEETDPIKKDILSLRYIIVIHKHVGATVYNRRLGEWQMEADLMGGFLSAMQDFSMEIQKNKVPIEKMSYKGYEIALEQGGVVLVALFIDGKGSEWIQEKQKLFVKKFEKYYESDLKNWKGELTQFRNTGYLVDEVFELYRV